MLILLPFYIKKETGKNNYQGERPDFGAPEKMTKRTHRKSITPCLSTTCHINYHSKRTQNEPKNRRNCQGNMDFNQQIFFYVDKFRQDRYCLFLMDSLIFENYSALRLYHRTTRFSPNNPLFADFQNRQNHFFHIDAKQARRRGRRRNAS